MEKKQRDSLLANLREILCILELRYYKGNRDINWYKAMISQIFEGIRFSGSDDKIKKSEFVILTVLR